jgi:hypothetical protein
MLLAHGGSGVLPPLADLSLDIFDALDGYDQERTTAYVLILRECVANAVMRADVGAGRVLDQPNCGACLRSSSCALFYFPAIRFLILIYPVWPRPFIAGRQSLTSS